MKLNTYDHSWEFIESCPCDQHLLDFIENHDLRGLNIFHFGSGNHHLVGRSPQNAARSNSVLAITASSQEYESYIDLVTQNPEVAKNYHLLFGDIYLLNEELLPMFDLVTLFHLGEYWKKNTADYGGITDAELLDLFFRKMKWKGLALFFTGSNAFKKVEPIIEKWCVQNNLKVLGEFASLLLVQKVLSE